MCTTQRYQGHELTAVSTQNSDGTYQARVAITMMPDGQTRSQRFADFECFPDRSQADERAMNGARAWVDDQLRRTGPSLLHEFGAAWAAFEKRAPVAADRRRSDDGPSARKVARS